MNEESPSFIFRLDLNSQCLVLDLRVKPRNAKNKRLTEISPWFCSEPVMCSLPARVSGSSFTGSCQMQLRFSNPADLWA